MICPACQQEDFDQAAGCFICGHQLGATVRRGAIIGARYEILERLGSGGMGTVYKAKDRVLDDIVALKVLRPDVARTQDMERRFRSEIKLARRVRHPNVCGIHEYGEEGELRFIAMELIEGTDLKQILRNREALSLEEAFDIPLQLAEGLRAIHEAGIIHRDLKTANVMRDARGIVRLMDFGIAKQMGASATSSTATMTGLILGTPEYMSPEQARGEPLDARSDIYALGIVIYEMFTGHVPFHGDTPVATLLKQVQDPPPLDPEHAPGIPRPLVPVLKKALAKNADQRYAGAKELIEDLRVARAASLARAITAVSPPTQPQPPVPAPEPPKPVAREELPPIAAPSPRPPRPPAAPESPRPWAPRTREVRPARPWILPVAVGLLLAAALATGAALVVVSLFPSASPQPSAEPAPTALPPPSVAQSPDVVPSPSSAPVATSASPPASATAFELPPTTAPRPSPPPATSPRPTLAIRDEVRRSAGPTPRPSAPDPEVAAPVAISPPTTLAANGSLQVIVRPWAEVSVDGRDVGTTPFRPLSLAPGSHSVVLTHPQYKPLHKKVTIQPDRVTRLEVDLSWEAFKK